MARRKIESGCSESDCVGEAGTTVAEGEPKETTDAEPVEVPNGDSGTKVGSGALSEAAAGSGAPSEAAAHSSVRARFAGGVQ